MPVQGPTDNGTPLLSRLTSVSSQGSSGTQRAYRPNIVTDTKQSFKDTIKYVSNIKVVHKPYWRVELNLHSQDLLAPLMLSTEVHSGPDQRVTVDDLDKVIKIIRRWSHGNLKGAMCLESYGNHWNPKLQTFFEHKSDLVMFKMVWL